MHVTMTRALVIVAEIVNVYVQPSLRTHRNATNMECQSDGGRSNCVVS